MRSGLPIDDVVPELLAELGRRRNFVLQAEPGAGKTTRIPVVLLEAGFAEAGEIWISQPRRIAARMAAARVASSLHEPVGGRCGFQVRFETVASPRTRLRFVTEGILAARLRDDPRLSGVGMVVLDEFHERHIDTDLALALLRRIQQTTRDDLRIGVMSATLDPTKVAAYLDAPAFACPGRTFPVHIEHAATGLPRDRSLGSPVAAALRMLGSEASGGNVLVFLPGAREIREASEACRTAADRAGLQIATLHGDLPSAQQDRVVDPGGPPRLILSTNVAETSVTIAGVSVVIDTGLARQASHNPWTGIPTLTLAKISQASAVQRAGRAGRTAAGRCLRLYTQADFDRRPAYDPPELQRLDLAAALLGLRAAGLEDPWALAWFEPPPEAAVEAAERLLRRLRAVDAGGALTDLGRAMLRFPLHPRLARLVVEGRARGIPETAAGAAAILSERPVLRQRTGRPSAGESVDLAHDLRCLREGDPDVERGAAATVERVRKQLRGLVGGRDRAEAPDDALAMALLLAFPDRVARRRDAGEVLVLAEGGSARLSPDSLVHHAEYVVAVDLEERKSGTRGPGVLVRSAAQIEPEWLFELLLDDIEEHVEVVFDPAAERVVATEELRYGALGLERRVLRELPPAAETVLADAAQARGPAAFTRDPAALEQLAHRSAFARRVEPTLPLLDEAHARAALAKLCRGRRGFAEIRAVDLLHAIVAELAPGVSSTLDRLAPTHVTLRGGRRLVVHYEPDRDPWAESRLQDFFGSVEGPRVGAGRVPVVLHLLAPNKRAVQVTTDLAGFWERHYPDLRRTLMRRYPKHAWPEDPRHADPPPPGGTRRR